MWGVSWCCSVNVTIIRREHLPYPKMTTPIVHNICFNGEKKKSKCVNNKTAQKKKNAENGT